MGTPRGAVVLPLFPQMDLWWMDVKQIDGCDSFPQMDYKRPPRFCSLTWDIKRASRRPRVVADSTLVGAVVVGLQLELQLRCLLQVRHRHADEVAIAEPADVCQARRVRPQDRARQGHHLIVPRAHVLEDRVQYRRIWGDTRIFFRHTVVTCQLI